MTDTEILDWMEKNVAGMKIYMSIPAIYDVTLTTVRGESHESIGQGSFRECMIEIIKQEGGSPDEQI